MMSLDPWAPTPTTVDHPADFLSEIEDMQASGQYDWAESTLEGIYETVEKSGVVTQGQRDAIDNIEAKGSKTGHWR